MVKSRIEIKCNKFRVHFLVVKHSGIIDCNLHTLNCHNNLTQVFNDP